MELGGVGSLPVLWGLAALAFVRYHKDPALWFKASLLVLPYFSLVRRMHDWGRGQCVESLDVFI